MSRAPADGVERRAHGPAQAWRWERGRTSFAPAWPESKGDEMAITNLLRAGANAALRRRIARVSNFLARRGLQGARLALAREPR